MGQATLWLSALRHCRGEAQQRCALKGTLSCAVWSLSLLSPIPLASWGRGKNSGKTVGLSPGCTDGQLCCLIAVGLVLHSAFQWACWCWEDHECSTQLFSEATTPIFVLPLSGGGDTTFLGLTGRKSHWEVLPDPSHPWTYTPQVSLTGLLQGFPVPRLVGQGVMKWGRSSLLGSLNQP